MLVDFFIIIFVKQEVYTGIFIIFQLQIHFAVFRFESVLFVEKLSELYRFLEIGILIILVN